MYNHVDKNYFGTFFFIVICHICILISAINLSNLNKIITNEVVLSYVIQKLVLRFSQLSPTTPFSLLLQFSLL